jgi:hypothetical protein
VPQTWKKTKEAQMSKLAELTQANNVLAIATEGRFAVIAENVTADQLCKIEEIVLPPEPAYAVGDWVQCGTMQAEIRELREILNGRQIYHMKDADGTEYDADSSAVVRKLKPSEVVVHIGCLSGTIEPDTDPDMFWLGESLIAKEMLYPTTRSLVERLLKAQEGEK